MKVEPVSNGNLRIWLSADELPTADDTGETWTLLRRVLITVQRSFARLEKRLVAELIPVADGGLLLVSACQYSCGSVPLYFIKDIEMLYDLAEAWVALPPAEHSCSTAGLYETQWGYAVALYPQPHLTRQETALLHTYATLVGSTAAQAAHTTEYGRLLMNGDVFFRLTASGPMPPEPPGPAH